MRLPRLIGAGLGFVAGGALAFGAASSPASPDAELAASIPRGQSLYFAHCSMCHGATGDGVKGVYPPLAKSDFIATSRSTAIRAVVNGLKDEIVVNGETYRGQMP